MSNNAGIILRYEDFINDVLKEDLKKIDGHLQRVVAEINEFRQIKQSLEVVQEKNTFPEGFKTQVDVGCSFFVQAKVVDTSPMLFDIGLNHYLEFTTDEANKFIELRIEALEKVCGELRKKSAATKAHIKLMLLGIAELQNINLNAK